MECILFAPFGRSTVDIIVKMKIDVLKIASCSACDWPLLEKAASSGKPMICSTGGLTLSEIDDLYSFLNHKGVDFSFMHCVSIYPTPFKDLQLNQINLMKKRYPDITIGWSTHEDQNEIAPVQIAYAKGAEMFERHIGIQTNKIKLNAYSSNPEQIEKWFVALNDAKNICGVKDGRHENTNNEMEAILSLQRGVFAKSNIKKGDIIKKSMVFFAMPIADNQLSSGNFKDNIIATENINKNDSIYFDKIKIPPLPVETIIKKAIHEVKAMLNEANVFLNTEFKIEYSHHYGISQFRKIGAVLIDIVNRDYCKKIIVQLPLQTHPQHFHKRKEETFQVLSGVLNVVIEGKKKILYPGDTCLIQPGMWHGFWTDQGCVFEEISTKHYNDDSFYKDKKINLMKREDRKTIVNHWGRYELTDKISQSKN